MAKPRKRVKQQSKLSSGQQRKYFRVVILLIVLAVLWVIFAPGAGLISYWIKRSELRELEEQTVKVNKENQLLQKDIDRLLNDPAYLEKVARSEFDLLKENEKVFDFSKKERKTNK